MLFMAMFFVFPMIVVAVAGLTILGLRGGLPLLVGYKKTLQFITMARRFMTAVAMVGLLLVSGLLLPTIFKPFAMADSFFSLQLGAAFPMFDTKIKSRTLDGAQFINDGRVLEPDAAVFFQTMIESGYDFRLGNSGFYISPLGFYRLTVGTLSYRQLIFPEVYSGIDNALIQRERLQHNLGAGFDLAYRGNDYGITLGLLASLQGFRYRETILYFVTNADYSDRTLPYQWQAAFTPRLGLTMKLAQSVDLGFLVDYTFSPKSEADGMLNLGLRAGIYF